MQHAWLTFWFPFIVSSQASRWRALSQSPEQHRSVAALFLFALRIELQETGYLYACSAEFDCLFFVEVSLARSLMSCLVPPVSQKAARPFLMYPQAKIGIRNLGSFVPLWLVNHWRSCGMCQSPLLGPAQRDIYDLPFIDASERAAPSKATPAFH